MAKITRPLLRYNGGKYILAPWIVSHFPAHRIYTEGFGGAASVLLRKPRCYCEVYNDMDMEIVNLFQICRDRGDELVQQLSLTPFSRIEFEVSYEETDDCLERARRTVIRAFMGFGSAAASGKRTGFRGNANQSGTTPARDWQNYPEALWAIIERLKGVIIESKDAISIMKQHDTPKTLHYADPPYVLNTRHMKEKTQEYRFEMTDDDHEKFIQEVQELEGMVIISGYDNELYNDLLKWRKISRAAHADGAKDRVEVLYFSPNINSNTLFTS